MCVCVCVCVCIYLNVESCNLSFMDSWIKNLNLGS